ncbi:MAG: hypothetical protein H6766_02605 [Candidatus Peribacteria bacterium]|nr:MAG: hypothetical protein H6766_02605 [Candidatus Peribacteria bacterium]
MSKKHLIHLLTIHQTILQSQWMGEIMQAEDIQPHDLQLTRDERQKSPSPLEVHHMIYRELGGSSKQRNEVSLPRHIHHRIHRAFPDLLPHEMIFQHTRSPLSPSINLSNPSSSLEQIYRNHILPDLGITTSEINPIVAKALAKD